MKRSQIVTAGWVVLMAGLASGRLAAGAETAPTAARVFQVGQGAMEGQGIALGPTGVIYATGQFLGTGQFGSVALPNKGTFDYYLSAHDAAGTVLWAVGAGSTKDDFGADVMVDAAGNIVVAGVLEGTVDFHGAATAQGIGKKDWFLAKYSPSGALLWVKVAGSAENDQAYDIGFDGLGNYVVAGRIAGEANFSGQTVGRAGENRLVIAKYYPSGDLVWAKDAGATGSTETCGVAVAVDGTIFLTGLNQSPAGPFVARYDAGGDQSWRLTAAGNPFFDEGSSVDFDDAGNVYFAGRFGGSELRFGSILLPNPEVTPRGFVAKIDPTGVPLWAKVAGARAFDVTVGEDGNAYVAGFTSAAANKVGAEVLENKGGLDVFAAKVTPEGELAWVVPGGTSQNDIARAIVQVPKGGTYLIGEGGAGLFGFANYPGRVFVADLRVVILPPTPPVMRARISGNLLVISWTGNSSEFALETTASIGVPFQSALAFSPVPGQPNTWTAPMPDYDVFFRVKAPWPPSEQ